MPPCARNEWGDNRKEGHKSPHRPRHYRSAEAVLQSINTSDNGTQTGTAAPRRDKINIRREGDWKNSITSRLGEHTPQAAYD